MTPTSDLQRVYYKNKRTERSVRCRAPSVVVGDQGARGWELGGVLGGGLGGGTVKTQGRMNEQLEKGKRHRGDGVGQTQEVMPDSCGGFQTPCPGPCPPSQTHTSP